MQPQNQGPAFNAGYTPAPAVYLDPASTAPEVDCAGAAGMAMGRRAALENMAAFGGNATPGTYSVTGGVDSAGSDADL